MDFKLKASEEIQKYVGKSAGKPAKIMAARGLVPLKSDVLFTVLFLLSKDSDAEVSEAATSSLKSQPKPIVLNVLKEKIHPMVLSFYADLYKSDSEVLEVIVTNRLTPDEVLLDLATVANTRIAEIIASNQTKLLENKDIAEGLRKNHNVSEAVKERVISFLRMNGIVLEGVKEELTKEEIQTIVEAPEDDLLASIFVDSNEDDLATLTQSLIEEKDDEESDPTLEANVLKKLSTLTTGEKIKLAVKGNKEARAALIKDPNKIICTSVIKNPRVKITEVVAFAQMRSLNDEVLRLIGNNPEWRKNYNIKVALTNNPKCPMPLVMTFMKSLRTNDLGILSRNKNVSQNVQKAAKRLFNAKR